LRVGCGRQGVPTVSQGGCTTEGAGIMGGMDYELTATRMERRGDALLREADRLDEIKMRGETAVFWLGAEPSQLSARSRYAARHHFESAAVLDDAA
jgi:hypothetical protein